MSDKRGPVDTSPKPVDIVVITYNRLLYLKDCIGSLIANTAHPHRIIVVDNNSEDGTREWLEEQGKAKKLIPVLLDENKGSAKARMIGIKKTKSKIIAISDDDAWFNPGWLEICIEALRLFPELAFVNGHNHGEPRKSNVLGTETRGDITVIFRKMLCPIHWVCHKKVLLDAGGFQLGPRQVMGYAGTPLCARVRKKGWQVAQLANRWTGDDGKIHSYVEAMDHPKHPKCKRQTYKKYTAFRDQAKKGRITRSPDGAAPEFIPDRPLKKK